MYQRYREYLSFSKILLLCLRMNSIGYINSPNRVRYRIVLISIFMSQLSFSILWAVPLQHGTSLTPAMKSSLEVTEYFVSEKLDGVRGYWDGKKLLSRQGYEIITPQWFIEHLGDKPLDGEIWLERGQFQEISGLIARNDVMDPLWQKVSFQVFDLPAEKGTFSERVKLMEHYLAALSQTNPHVVMIPQVRVQDLETLEIQLTAVIANKGEGLMLHHQDARYQAYDRHKGLLKVKRIDKGCATVVGYTNGKGKYAGKVGALIVEARIDGDGEWFTKSFRIGSGLTDEDRENPPKIGQSVPYHHNDFTQKGIPRFPRLGKDFSICSELMLRQKAM